MSPQRIVLAEYFTTEELTLLFIVREDFEEPKVIEIPKPLKEIQKFVIEHFREERNQKGELLKSSSDQIRRLDEAAYQAFFEPFVAPLLSQSDKGDLITNEGDIIWLVPHDVLHYLPLHALKVDGQYLMERNPICVTPSASVMKYCHAKRKGRREKALVLGDSLNDLPRAREEALMVAQMFNTTPVLGPQASKSLLKEALEQRRDEIDILHLACHGYFDPYQPLKSGIKLARGQNGNQNATHEQQWNLTAEEIFGLSMKADLVTLSACESGVNERKPGDELMGLTRSLIYAGTPSVLVTLWRVSDLSTQILMKEFYTRLKSGMIKVEALRQAQIKVMTMTVQEVITYCQELKEHLPTTTYAQRRLEQDIANLRFKARYFKVALAEYTQLLQEVEPGSSEARDLKKALSRCKRALRRPKPIDYGVQVYTKPYHWAPFVLVGDWK